MYLMSGNPDIEGRKAWVGLDVVARVRDNGDALDRGAISPCAVAGLAEQVGGELNTHAGGRGNGCPDSGSPVSGVARAVRYLQAAY